MLPFIGLNKRSQCTFYTPSYVLIGPLLILQTAKLKHLWSISHASIQFLLTALIEMPCSLSCSGDVCAAIFPPSVRRPFQLSKATAKVCTTTLSRCSTTYKSKKVREALNRCQDSSLLNCLGPCDGSTENVSSYPLPVSSETCRRRRHTERQTDHSDESRQNIWMFSMQHVNTSCLSAKTPSWRARMTLSNDTSIESNQR